jgi:immune inhibitor A
VRKNSAGLLSLAVVAGLGTTLGVSSVSAAPVPAATLVPQAAEPAPRGGDELAGPLEDKRRALREEALTELLNGTGKVEKRGASTVMKVSSTTAPKAVNARGAVRKQATTTDQYVELSREKTDRIFVVLAEFGDERDPRYPDKDVNPATEGPVTWNGPLHDRIPAPDRSTDNSTIWQSSYDRAHFEELYFGQGDAAGSGGETESVKQYYERQSSGRYSVDGTVTNWVKVKYNEARYGRSSDVNNVDPNVCSGHVCSNSYDLVRDAVNKWYEDQLAAGRTAAAVDRELRTFDQWDRYDADADGNFNEPDGYLDHFQIVHAGGDEANGDPIQGEDAIWSHRSYAYVTDAGRTGPAGARLGGTQVGTSGLWVGDYTMQPENGGMSVFAHEYAHDLGLPDLYDTSGGGDNAVEHWSLMAQNRLSAPGEDGIGTRAGDMGAWEKLQLGWLDYETVRAGQDRRIELGPHEYNSDDAQAAAVVLPKKQVTSNLVTPYAGSRSWWSGTGDDYTASMTRSVTLPAGSAQLAFQASYNMETDYDYAFVEVNPGTGWVSVPGTGTRPAANNGLTGDTAGAWKPLSFDLSAYAGKTVDLRIRYTTDGGVQGQDPKLAPGLFIDALTVTGGFADGAETSPNGWTLAGFSSVGSTITRSYDNYYLASNRTYTSYDTYLQSGPYYFGYQNTKPDLVDHYAYQNGLLVSYWDTSQSDNNTHVHPGAGLILPVDSHPRPLVRLDGGLWRPRVATYDSPFGLEKADSMTLHHNGQANYVRGQAAVRQFQDNRPYWDADQPEASVKVPNNRVDIKVLSQHGTAMGIRVSARD